MDQLRFKTLPELKSIAQYYMISFYGLNKSDLIKKIMTKLVVDIIITFPAYQSIKKMGYNLEWTLDPDEMSKLCCICKPNLLAHSYETLAYESVDAEEGIIGLYIIKDNNIILTCIIDLGCTQVCDISHIPANIINNYLEITLLCSNPVHRIPGIASLVLDFVKQISAAIGKKHLLLIISNYEKNPSAIQFYKRNGFIPTNKKEIMKYDL
jgi:hypothetical protein